MGMSQHRTRTTDELVTALMPYQQVTPLVDGIAASLGYISFGDMGKAQDLAVGAFWIDPAEEVFTCWMRTPNQLVLHQRSKSGIAFSLNVPVSRLRRVSEEIASDGSRRVVIEIDADRDVIELIRSEQDGGVRTAGAILPASYTLLASPERAGDLSRFVRDLRRSLL